MNYTDLPSAIREIVKNGENKCAVTSLAPGKGGVQKIVMNVDGNSRPLTINPKKPLTSKKLHKVLGLN